MAVIYKGGQGGKQPKTKEGKLRIVIIFENDYTFDGQDMSFLALY